MHGISFPRKGLAGASDAATPRLAVAGSPRPHHRRRLGSPRSCPVPGGAPRGEGARWRGLISRWMERWLRRRRAPPLQAQRPPTWRPAPWTRCSSTATSTSTPAPPRPPQIPTPIPPPRKQQQQRRHRRVRRPQGLGPRFPRPPLPGPLLDALYDLLDANHLGIEGLRATRPSSDRGPPT
jgi:hypothetical protein